MIVISTSLGKIIVISLKVALGLLILMMLQTSKTCVVSFNAGHDRMKYYKCVAKGVHKSLTAEKQSAQ